MRPLGNRVLLREERESQKTEGGLFLPEQTITTTVKCRVMASGPSSSIVEGIVYVYRHDLGPMVAPDKYIVSEDNIIAIE